MTVDMADSELKTRHSAMWASGDYPLMVETFLLPLGPRLVEACGIGEGTRVLDVAAGTGNASIPAAQRGAKVTASDLTAPLLEAGRNRPEARGLEIEWITADAENLPFEDESFDVVMSSIGVMFAPHHQASADELVRVCRPGGTIGLISWTPEGMIGALFRTMKEFATAQRDVLEITAFERPGDWGEHFKSCYGPTIAARKNAVKNGLEADFDAAMTAFCDEWGSGESPARFEQEYLLSVGTRR